MAATVMIPTALRRFADNKDKLEIEGKATIGEVLGEVTSNHAELKKHLYNEEGNLRSFVNIYLNNEDIRYIDKENSAVKDGDVIMIVPSIAGGNH